MKIKFFFGVLAFLLTVCYNYRQDSFAQTTLENKLMADTIVGSKNVINEISGSSFRKKAIGYFVIINNDTSGYTCIFTESKEGGKVGIDLNIKYFTAKMSYQKRLDELKIILPAAAKDFNFDSLTSISFGRLILSGDLAIDVTKQYRQKFGTSNTLEDYETVEQFLIKSKLGTDLDRLFEEYSISVDDVSIEKLFLTTRKELFLTCKIETDSTNIPDKILDCMTWVKLTKK